MTTIAPLLIAALGSFAPVAFIQPESAADYVALAILGVVLFKFTHDLVAGRSSRR